MEPRGREPSSLHHRAENHPVLEQLRGGGWGKPLGGVYQGRTAVLWLVLKKLITEKLEKVMELLKLTPQTAQTPPTLPTPVIL